MEGEYSLFVAKRFKFQPEHIQSLLHAAVGICGEGGELIDAVKKSWVYGKELDRENVKEELGDLLFYIQAAANLMHTTMGDLMSQNMAKLRRRYPDGYSDAAAIARADKA